ARVVVELPAHAASARRVAHALSKCVIAIAEAVLNPRAILRLLVPAAVALGPAPQMRVPGKLVACLTHPLPDLREMHIGPRRVAVDTGDLLVGADTPRDSQRVPEVIHGLVANLPRAPRTLGEAAPAHQLPRVIARAAVARAVGIAVATHHHAKLRPAGDA